MNYPATGQSWNSPLKLGGFSNFGGEFQLCPIGRIIHDPPSVNGCQRLGLACVVFPRADAHL